MSKKARAWLNTNGLGLVQLIFLGAIFYVSTVAGEISRKEVEKHTASLGHPAMLDMVNKNATEIVLIKQKFDLIQAQNTEQHDRLLEVQKANTRVLHKIAVKLQVDL